jgi:stage II sporulation protein D
LEIANTDYGYVIVNELDLENYLYAVIPSEMPTSFGAAAAQTQAIVSRSYAINGFYANRYHEYGANIDDSVKCQVYNNIPETEISIDAANATKGIAISYNGAVVDAVFCSTGAGVSANAGEVWADISANRFPSETKDYLKASIPEGFSVDEAYFTEFIKADKTKVDCYDKESPWFRWSAVMTSEQLTSSINNNIARLYEAYPSLIKTMTREGSYRSRPIESVGFVTDVEISTRGEAGNAMQLKITGTSGSVLINSEYLIRSVLAPKKYSTDLGDVVLNLADGSTMTNYGILPSAFFIIEKDYETNENGDPINNAIKSVTFYGGGNGHGVGLSQYGAKGMADLGFTPEEIIEYYFKGTRLINFYG